MIAARLSEDRDVTVLVLEAGHDDRNEDILNIPSETPKTQRSKFDWEYFTEPQTQACWTLKDKVLIYSFLGYKYYIQVSVGCSLVVLLLCSSCYLLCFVHAHCCSFKNIYICLNSEHNLNDKTIYVIKQHISQQNKVEGACM